MNPPAPALAVVVFAFDEEENVGPVLAELRSWLERNEPTAEIVFVDDGSRDGTLDAARRALDGFPSRFVRHERNRGIGAALKSGVCATEAPWVTFMPADGQIAPDAIGTLRAAGTDGSVDAVFSVYDHRDDGLDRKILSFGVRALITLVHGVRLASDGPYLFRRDTFDPELLAPDTFFLNFEYPIRMLAQGRSTRVVTIACRPRRAGSSKSTGLSRIVGVARDLFDLRVRRWRGR